MKITIRLYYYKFEGIEKPVCIEAYNRKQARETLRKRVESLPDSYANRKVISETVCIPLIGVSTKKMNGESYVWVGRDHSESGWEKGESKTDILYGQNG